MAIVDFMIGSFIGPKSEEERAKGFLGYNSKLNKSPYYLSPYLCEFSFFFCYRYFI